MGPLIMAFLPHWVFVRRSGTLRQSNGIKSRSPSILLAKAGSTLLWISKGVFGACQPVMLYPPKKTVEIQQSKGNVRSDYSIGRGARREGTLAGHVAEFRVVEEMKSVSQSRRAAKLKEPSDMMIRHSRLPHRRQKQRRRAAAARTRTHTEQQQQLVNRLIP